MSAFERAMNELKHAEESGDVQAAYAGTNKAAAVRVRKAFMKAKEALHDGRQEVQAIKKGEDHPVEDLTEYFTDDDE